MIFQTLSQNRNAHINIQRYTHATGCMYTYKCVCTNISRYDPFKSLECVCVWGWARMGVSGRNTNLSTPIYYLFRPKYEHTNVCDPSPWQWTALGPVLMQPSLAQTGPDHSSGWNSCHSVMADSGDIFRPKALSLKAPVALSHPSARPWRGPDLELCFHLLHRQGHASFRTNTVEGEPWLSSRVYHCFGLFN